MMNRNQIICASLIGLLVSGFLAAKCVSAQSEAADMSTWIDRDAVAVIRVDVERLLETVTPDLVQQFAEQAKLEAEQVEVAKAIVERARQLGQEFSQAGGREVWCVLSVADFPMGSPLIIVRGQSDNAAKELTAWLKWLCSTQEAGNLEVVQHDPTTWLMGSPTTLQRVRAQKPVERPEFQAALAALEPQPVVGLVHLSSDQRRVLREMFPELPEPWQDINGELLADGIRGLSVRLDPRAEVVLQIALETRSGADAQLVSAAIQKGLEFVTQLPQVQKQYPQAQLLAKSLRPQVADRKVQVLLKNDAFQASLLQIVGQPLTAARQAAKRQQCMNNLKQIGLAMHNYYEQHKTFPPAASRDEQGRPLLSWRVHLLPQLGLQALYDQFHLDEPWDSEHNRKLISQMPRMFVCPETAGIEHGKTTYVLPIGDGTVWGGEQPLSFREITDGTSNTVMVVEVAQDKAVEWTRPQDVTVRSDAPTEGLGRAHGPGTLVLFCDGSVRFLSSDVSPEMIWAMLGATDGQVIKE